MPADTVAREWAFVTVLKKNQNWAEAEPGVGGVLASLETSAVVTWVGIIVIGR